MKNAAKAKRIIERNIYMVISSASRAGVPWITPVFFAPDERGDLYWVSYRGAKHSHLIRRNPRVAIVIFDSTAPEGTATAAYFEARAIELSHERDIRRGMAALGKRVTIDKYRVKSPADVMGAKSWRMYRATPRAAYVLGTGTIIGGQHADRKASVRLERLRRVLDKKRA